LANDSCEAFQSFRKKTNPEGIHLESGKFYKILEKNKRKTAYRVRVEGIKRSARWVSESCGESLSICTLSDNNRKLAGVSSSPKKSKPKKRRKQPEYLLALTWQPSFCETHSRKKECRTQTRNRYDATHWSLHGLWPQPRNNAYCGVSDMDKGIDRTKKWHLLAPVKLSQKTATELAFVMPAVASNLQRHEWIKHGTCYGSDAEDYYSDAISLTNQINNSIVGKLFNRGVGKRVSLKQVRQHFDKAFGKGAGSKVDMRCDRKGRVSELWINLKGEVEDDTKIATLLKNALRAGSKCQIGVIDSANR
jgi:ribonuclease T2